ncbi:hypothetical protein PoB_004494700 [Plakobranchus ocellatus]|uniref:Uncharacterized protein n=1 Tax=Plakobranchus ocellatus TaxID=259542 RepID=A0AAV4BGC1_9GAST|nr:hypothetical protein PoB_004494700 [Plakobranchus ocellatus]
MNVTDHIKTIQHKGETFFRTYQGLDSIPCLPGKHSKKISEDEERDLAKIFVMLANLPNPSTPYYRLFMKNTSIRPKNIAQWPIFELIETEEISIMANLAQAKLKDWLIRHRNGDSDAPDDETQDLGDLDEEKNNNNNNNNDQALTPPKLSCFPPLKTLRFARKVVKGIKILIVMTDLMLNLLDLSFGSSSS